MHAVSWLSLGYKENATALFTRSYANSQKPFGVWTETPQGKKSFYFILFSYLF